MSLISCENELLIDGLCIGLATAIVSYGAGVLVKRTGIVDSPDDDRKTQSVAVARLGGVAIFSAFLITPILLSSVFGLVPCQSPLSFGMGNPSIPWWIIPAFLSIAFGLGLADDLWKIPTHIKLLSLLLACIGAASFGLHPLSIESPIGIVTQPAILIGGAILWLLVFTNAANFMDGSDGLAVGCLLIMFLGLAVLDGAFSDKHGLYGMFTGVGFAWFALFGAIVGFLIHNLRGTLYAGDAGALGLGALFASLGLASRLEVWTVATLALPFLIDVLLTLIWRAKHKRSWLEPHRDHAYQRLIDSGWSHIEVAVLYWGLSASCAVAAIITAKAGGEAPFVIFWTLTLAGSVMWSLNRREYRAP